AMARIVDQMGVVHGVDIGSSLAVAQLPHVEVHVQTRIRRPAEKNVAGRLHQQLSFNDALAVIAVGTAARVGLEHRSACLLELEKERVVVTSHEERNDTAGSDAAYTDDLDRDVD